MFLEDNNEKWVWVPKWEGRYEISNKGRIRGCKSKHGKYIEDESKRHILKQCLRRGYMFVSLEHSGVRKENVNIHRCMMLAFCSIEDSDNLIVNHKDGNKLNNILENLEWVTPKENIQHYWDNKDKLDTFKERRENSCSKLTIHYNSILFESLRSFSEYIGVCSTTARRRLKKYENIENPLVFVLPDDF